MTIQNAGIGKKTISEIIEEYYQQLVAVGCDNPATRYALERFAVCLQAEWGTSHSLASERGREWQPIETAPKDGTRILIWQPSFGRDILSAKWCAEFEAVGQTRGGKTKWEGAWTDGAVKSFGYEECMSYEPTHWMRLPEPPRD